MTMNTHHLICDFGRHNGAPYTRIPVSYLRWMVNTGRSRADIAKAEIERRGTVTPDLDVSGHAIDRASTCCRRIWHQTAASDSEGLHAWLCRVAAEALVMNVRDGDGCYLRMGMRFVFDESGAWPVLKTVMRKQEAFDQPEKKE